MTRQVVLCRWHFFVSLPVSLVDGNEWRSVRLMSPRWMLRPAKMFAWKSYGNFEDSCLEHSIGDRTTKFRDYLGIKQQIAMNHNFFSVFRALFPSWEIQMKNCLCWINATEWWSGGTTIYARRNGGDMNVCLDDIIERLSSIHTVQTRS